MSTSTPQPLDKIRKHFLKKPDKIPHGVRPIVWGCNDPIECISAFLDHNLLVSITTRPYINNSPHLMLLLENTPVPENAVLATIDVSSLYTNIPEDVGKEACLDAIKAADASHNYT